MLMFPALAGMALGEVVADFAPSSTSDEGEHGGVEHVVQHVDEGEHGVVEHVVQHVGRGRARDQARADPPAQAFR